MTAEPPSSVYLRLCKLDPASPLSHFTYGRALYLEKNFKAAMGAFEKCIDIDPNYLLAYLLAGQTCEKSGSTNQAKNIYSEGRKRARRLKDTDFEKQFHALGATLD